jgi:hypothetical protein
MSTNTRRRMLIILLFIIAILETTQMSTNRRMDKLLYIYSIEICVAINKIVG